MSSALTGPLFRLLPSEDWGAGLRRVVLQQLSLAHAELRQRRSGIDEAVHSARKSCKRTRAVLRLMRTAIGDAPYQEENRAVRDAARRLAALRDARVLLETAGALRAAAPGEGIELWRQLEQELTAELVERRERAEHGDLHAARGLLAAVSGRAHGWRYAGDPRASAAAGLFRVYREGRRLGAALGDGPFLAGDGAGGKSDEQFHSWRKASKYFLYQMMVLRAYQSGSLLAVHAACRTLCQRLGEINDLAVLRAYLLARDPQTHAAETALAMERLDRRQLELQELARGGGRQVYFREPSEMVAAFGLEPPRS